MQFLLVVLASSGPSGLGPVLRDCRAPVGQKGTDSVVLFFFCKLALGHVYCLNSKNNSKYSYCR